MLLLALAVPSIMLLAFALFAPSFEAPSATQAERLQNLQRNGWL